MIADLKKKEDNLDSIRHQLKMLTDIKNDMQDETIKLRARAEHRLEQLFGLIDPAQHKSLHNRLKSIYGEEFSNDFISKDNGRTDK